MKKFISIFLILIISGTSTTSFAKTNYDIDSVLDDTVSYIYKTVREPQVDSVGGEWAVLGLARSGIEISDEYYKNYYENVEEYVRECKGNLHDKKYTEYSRVVLALTSIGKDPSDVAGYNLLIPLADYEKTVWQGLNGAVWALIAFDAGGYDIPLNPYANIQATREMYVNHILDNQLPNGSWVLKSTLDSDVFDPDMTGMALQALSKYKENDQVKQAIDKALVCIAEHQNNDGGFDGYEKSNIESSVQILVALCELGISADDPRFTKDGNTIFDNIMTYYTGDGFMHSKDQNNVDQMATEQALYGLVALHRQKEGKNSLYDMSDALLVIPNNSPESVGLAGKNPHVQKMAIIYTNKTFTDISGHVHQKSIEELASRGIINGKSADAFEPDSTMTRAEFATIITRGLGLPMKEQDVFSDMNEDDWFFDYVNTAYAYGIIKGISETSFNPHGTISKEEAAVMIARAAELCGMDVKMNADQIRDILAVFSDYKTASDWSVEALAFCYNENIISQEDLSIEPKYQITRAQISQMLFNLLGLTKLL